MSDVIQSIHKGVLESPLQLQDHAGAQQGFLNGATPSQPFGVGALFVVSDSAFRTYIGAGTSSFNGAYSALSGIPTAFVPSAHAASHALGGTDPITAASIGAATLASPALSGVPTAPTATAGTNTTQIATTAFVASAVSTAVTGLLSFKGSIDCSGNPNYPSASKGDSYIVSVPGRIGGASGTSVDVGDWYIAEANNVGGTEASVGSSWGHMEHNLVGALLASNNLSDIGNATTARSNLVLGNVENTALSTWAGSGNITTLGTVTSGTFSGTLGAISGASLTALTAANITASTSAGRNILNLTNPSAISFIKIAADNTVSTRTPAQVLSDIGAQASGSYALTTSNLSQFAATTSAQLRGVLSDENGTGVALFDSSTSATFITPILGTPTSGNLANCTFPTLNQNTTGSAANWTTGRNLAGNSVDGSANVAFANKFIVQGTVDAGLSAAQFLGALGTGILKSTTTTGVLSIAVAGDFPTLNQNTSGLAGTATALATGRTLAITGDLTWTSPSFDGSGNVTAAGTLATVATAGTTGSSTAIPVITINAKGLSTSITTAAVIAPAGTLSGATLNSGVTASSLISFGSSPAFTTPAITGLATGSGVASAATASTLASRDANANLTANNLLGGYTTTATAAGTTTLTVGSTYAQFFTGSTTQTVTLPVASTLALGHQFVIANNSTGNVTVNSSGANAVIILGGGTSATITCILASGTTAASWNVSYFADVVASGKKLNVSNSLTLAGTDGTTMTFPSGSQTLASLAGTETLTNKTLDNTNAATLLEAQFKLQNTSDPTKQAQFSLAAIATGTTVTFNIQNSASQTLAFNGNNLGFFASTTSAQLASIISDETGTGALVFGTSPVFVTPALGTPASGNLTNCTFPALNQNTTGSAASLSISGQTGLLTITGLASTSRIKTVRDAADTILELGGSYTPTGTWTSMTLVTPAIGTPASGVVTNLTGTASININGTVGATTPAAGTFTTLVAGSTTSLLLGTAGSAVGNVGFRNATSGTATLAPPTGALGTYSVTLPNAASTLPIFGQQITFAGPTAARTVTFPDVSFTVARIDAANTFVGVQTMTSPSISGTSTSITNVGTFALRDTSAAFDLTIAAASGTTLTAGRTLTLDAGNVAHTLAFGTTANTITFPNAASGTVPFLNLAQTWTALQSFGTNLGGTLQTAAQPNVTSLGNLSKVTIYAADDGTDSALSIRQSNATTNGFDWLVDQLVDGAMTLNRVSSGTPTTCLTIGRNTPGFTFADKVIFGATARLKVYTVSTLPAGTQGDTAAVNDALAPSFLSVVVGGGATFVPVVYNGANWVGY